MHISAVAPDLPAAAEPGLSQPARVRDGEGGMRIEVWPDELRCAAAELGRVIAEVERLGIARQLESAAAAVPGGRLAASAAAAAGPVAAGPGAGACRAGGARVLARSGGRGLCGRRVARFGLARHAGCRSARCGRCRVTVVVSQLSGWHAEELSAAGTALRAASRELSVLAARVAAPELNRASWTGVAADAAAQHAAEARRRFDAMASVLDLSGLQLYAAARMLQIAACSSRSRSPARRARGSPWPRTAPSMYRSCRRRTLPSVRSPQQQRGRPRWCSAPKAPRRLRAQRWQRPSEPMRLRRRLWTAPAWSVPVSVLRRRPWLALWAAELTGSGAAGADGCATGAVEARQPAGSWHGPRGRRVLWAGLSPADRDIAIRAHTHHVGALDGLPGEVRHRANLLALQAGIADARAALASRRRPLTEAVELMSRLKRLEAVAAELSADPVRRRLLLLDDDGHLAAIAIGDVDTADHVAVVVPGLEQDVAEDMDAVVYNADRLAGTADSWLQRLAPGETFAAVAWLGYDTPSFATVASSREAIRGAAALRSTLRGLDVARTAVPTPRGAPSGELHLTVVGHSYGSLATGIALREPTGADDAVLIGSPGVDAQTAADLAVPVGHVFVGEATGDTVADLAWFGRDPSDSRFDAVPLPVDGGVDPETGKSMTESRGHSEYFETGSESVRNMALVAVGESHRLTVPGRSAGTPP
jgi:hypothetical protein